MIISVHATYRPKNLRPTFSTKINVLQYHNAWNVNSSTLKTINGLHAQFLEAVIKDLKFRDKTSFVQKTKPHFVVGIIGVVSVNGGCVKIFRAAHALSAAITFFPYLTQIKN